MEQMSKMEEATFAAGCFWCVEAVFQRINGVIRVESGYAGGHIKNPSYREVCSGRTGHAEVVHIVFNPGIVSYGELLQVFWHSHDPTTADRQGADRGTQYRSVIFYHNEAQKEEALNSRRACDDSALWPDPVVTSVEALKNYFPAEIEHQNYFALHGHEPYCALVIRPKIAKLEKDFPYLIKIHA